MPLKVTGVPTDNPLASLKPAVIVHALEFIFNPLSQKVSPEKRTTPPIREKPTMASRKLRRIIFNDLRVALVLEDYLYGTVLHKDFYFL